jgi:hypothetical protein
MSSQKGRLTVLTLERVQEVKGVIRLINRDRSDDPNLFDLLGLTSQYT